MNARLLVLVVVAFLLGALAAGSIGVRVIREVRTDEDATSLPTETTTTAAAPTPSATYQVDARETMIGSTALVPTSFRLSGSQFSIEYDLVTRAPYEGVEPVVFVGGFGVITRVDNADLDHIYPRSWVLETDGGPIDGGPANAEARVARFEVPRGFTPDDVRQVRITEALMPFPVDVPFTLSEAEPRAEVYPGVVVELVNISDQGSTTIVQVAIERDDPETMSFFVQGDGPSWRSAVFEAEGRPRVNLTWVGGELPEDIPLVAEGEVWIGAGNSFVVTPGGLDG